MSFIFSIKDNYRASVEAATGGKNTVLYDDQGNPSIMVAIPKFKIKDVIDGGADATHPAFIVNGIEKDVIYISKYQNVVYDNRAYSLPGIDPATYVNFDQALQYCYNKGQGWHLMSNAEWAAIALWCKKNGFMPRGNNNYGCDISAAHEKGKETSKDTTKTGRVATGSGPASWAHDGTPNGIYDLNGNIGEWNSGMRINGGEIQIIENNNAAILNADHSVNSQLWKAILQDGSLVAPGTADTLKWDYANSKITLATSITTQADASRSTNFELLANAVGVTTPEILKALAMHPAGTSYESDNVWMNNLGERLPCRGANWITGASAGVFALTLNYSRSISYSTFGFRSAYVSV